MRTYIFSTIFMKGTISIEVSLIFKDKRKLYMKPMTFYTDHKPEQIDKITSWETLYQSLSDSNSSQHFNLSLKLRRLRELRNLFDGKLGLLSLLTAQQRDKNFSAREKNFLFDFHFSVSSKDINFQRVSLISDTLRVRIVVVSG